MYSVTSRAAHQQSSSDPSRLSLWWEEAGRAPEGADFGPRRVQTRDLVGFSAVFLTCCCVAAGCQGFGLSRRSAAVLPPLHLCPLSSLLSSVTGAAGGRWWVLCSLATPLVDGDWYAALFECLSLRAREGDAWTKQALLKLPLLLLFAQARQRGRTNISAQRNRDSNLQQRPRKCNSGGLQTSVKGLQVSLEKWMYQTCTLFNEEVSSVTNFFSTSKQSNCCFLGSLWWSTCLSCVSFSNICCFLFDWDFCSFETWPDAV